MLRATINGREHTFREGLTVLEALRVIGVSVPALCDDPRLRPQGGCRLCAVQVEGHPQPLVACMTRLEPGLKIETHTEAIEHERRMLLAAQAHRYPAAALREFPDKEFHRLLVRYGVEREAGQGARPAAAGELRTYVRDDSHPFIRVDMSRCVDCYRCVRICDELQGQFVWKAVNRGHHTEVTPGQGLTLLESACVGCGACVDTCPSGAIEDRTRIEAGPATAWTRSTCAYCGVGCEIQVGTRDGTIVQITPALDGPVNLGHLCEKGRYAFAYVDASDRVTAPMVRERGAWKRVSWAEAIARAAADLSRIVARDGPEAVGVLGSARATNEENYLAQKFARVVLGTHNVDCCARVCHAPTAAAMAAMLGAGAATGCYDDIEAARTLLLFGANATEAHPVLGARVRQAARRGTALIVVDPRAIELAEHAERHLALRPGTNVPLLHAMAHVIVEEGLSHTDFVARRVSDLEPYRAFIREWTPERAAAICGVAAADIRAAARRYATGSPALILHGLGATEHTQGTDSVACLVNLALLTGNIGRPGAGIVPLRGQNNVQGAAHMGCEPSHLTGYVMLERGREDFERAWGVPLPRAPGLNLMEMMDASRAGRLKGLWVTGYDILLTNPGMDATRSALAALEVLIVQDLFMNETAREFGTVFLPACSSFEKDGTFMNAERRVQRVRRALEPRGESKPDAWIVCELARAMGRGDAFAFESAEAVWEEIRRVWKAGAGITYTRLESAGLQWPCPAEDHPGTARLHADGFVAGPRAALRRAAYAPTAEQADDHYPFLLVTGRTLYPFNAGTMTGRTRNPELRPTDTLDLSPVDAERLGLQGGEPVTLRSRHGAARLPARIDPRVKPGELFASFHAAETGLNRVTSPHRDRETATPEYKVTAVRIEVDP